jgi:hypothetical protein
MSIQGALCPWGWLSNLQTQRREDDEQDVAKVEAVGNAQCKAEDHTKDAGPDRGMLAIDLLICSLNRVQVRWLPAAPAGM